MDKICPLARAGNMISLERQRICDCLKEDCAWWIDRIENTNNHIKRGCAIKLLAEGK